MNHLTIYIQGLSLFIKIMIQNNLLDLAASWILKNMQLFTIQK